MTAVFTPRTIEGYRISTTVYDGPLDLLLDLIERAELDITTLALAQVTDQYLAHLAEMQDRNPEEVSAFLVVASRLLQIKSAALLPRPPRGETPPEVDDGEALAQQLILYRRFKQLAGQISERDLAGMHTYLRVAAPVYKVEPQLDLSGLTLLEFLEAARRVFRNGNHLTNLDEVVSLPRITIREKISAILTTLKTTGGTSFRAILKNSSRVEVVVTFLALLELVKRYIVTTRQADLFADIQLDPVEGWQAEGEFEVEFNE